MLETHYPYTPYRNMYPSFLVRSGIIIDIRFSSVGSGLLLRVLGDDDRPPPDGFGLPRADFFFLRFGDLEVRAPCVAV